MEDQHRVFDRPRYGTELVKRPAERHCAGARYAAECGAQPSHATSHRGTDDAAASFTANGKCHECRGRRRPGSSARSRRALFQKPGVNRLAAEPDIVERQRPERQLRDQHRACVVQPANDGRVFRRHPVPKGLSAIGRWDVLCVEQILYAVRDAVQWTSILARSDLGVGLLCARQRMVFGDRDDRANLPVESFDATEIDIRESLRRDLPRLDPSRQLCHGRKRDRVVR